MLQPTSDTSQTNMRVGCEGVHVYCTSSKCSGDGKGINGNNFGKYRAHVRRRPLSRSGGGFATFALGVALASAITAAGSSSPSQPAAAMTNGKLDRRWADWNGAPPGPPPDPPITNGVNMPLEGGGDGDSRSLRNLDGSVPGGWVGRPPAPGPTMSEEDGLRKGYVDNLVEPVRRGGVGMAQLPESDPQRTEDQDGPHPHQFGGQLSRQQDSSPSLGRQDGAASRGFMYGLEQEPGSGSTAGGPSVHPPGGMPQNYYPQNNQYYPATSHQQQPPTPPFWGRPNVPPPPTAPGQGGHDAPTAPASIRPDRPHDPSSNGGGYNALAAPGLHQPSLASDGFVQGRMGEPSEGMTPDGAHDSPPHMWMGALPPEVSQRSAVEGSRALGVEGPALGMMHRRCHSLGRPHDASSQALGASVGMEFEGASAGLRLVLCARCLSLVAECLTLYLVARQPPWCPRRMSSAVLSRYKGEVVLASW